MPSGSVDRSRAILLIANGKLKTSRHMLRRIYLPIKTYSGKKKSGNVSLRINISIILLLKVIISSKLRCMKTSEETELYSL